jgi:hypothetical protein
MKYEEQNIWLNVMMMDLSWKESHGIQNNSTEHSKGNIIADKRQVLRVWVTYITQLYGQHNWPENLEGKPQEEVDADERGLYILRSAKSY